MGPDRRRTAMSRQRHTHSARRAAADKPERGLRALAVALAKLRPSAPAQPEGEPQPASAWERRAEQRLNVIEKQLSNQNRLLLLTLVSIVADVLIGMSK